MRSQENGFLLIAAIIILVVVAATAGAITYIFTGSSIATAHNFAAKKTIYIAEAGLEKGTHHVMSSPSPLNTICNSITGQPAFTNVPFDNGKFSDHGDYFHPTTTKLSADINDTQTVIPLNSTAEIAPQGQLDIGSEKMLYGGISNDDSICNVTGGTPCLYDVNRGTDGSTTETHKINDPVTQDQCDVTATGAFPGLNPMATASGQQALKQTIIQEGSNDAWAVGPYGKIAYFNGESWISVHSPITKNLNSVYMLNGNFGFAVGDGGKILKYDGSSWTVNATISNVDLNDVIITGPHSAWAVGKKTSGGCSGEDDDDDSMHGKVNINPYHHAKLTLGHPHLTLGKKDDDDEDDDDGKGGHHSSSEGVILHWNGSTWSTVYTYSKELKGISVLNDDSLGFAVGVDNTILKHTGSNPTSWSVGHGPNSGQTLYKVQIMSNLQAWAVGDKDGGNGHDDDSMHGVTHMMPNHQPKLTIGHPSLTLGKKDDDDEDDDDDKYSGGGGGYSGSSVIYWNGSAWSNVTIPKEMTYYAIHMYDTSKNGEADYGFVGGQGGHVLIYNGSSWTWHTTPGSHIYGIAAFSQNDAWAVGQHTKYWDGSNWTKLNYSFNDISITDQGITKKIVYFVEKY